MLRLRSSKSTGLIRIQKKMLHLRSSKSTGLIRIQKNANHLDSDIPVISIFKTTRFDVSKRYLKSFVLRGESFLPVSTLVL